MTGRFENKTVVVTGAAGGMGRTFAQRFAEEGAALVLTDVDEPGLAETASLVDAAGASCSQYVLDLANEADIHKVAAEISSQHDAINVLVNNAGIAFGEISQNFAELSQQRWLYFLSVNTVAPLLLAQALRNKMAGCDAVVINMSSMMSYVPIITYGVTKASLNAMTYGMSKTFASDGIRVVGIAPGYIDTPAARASGSEETRAFIIDQQAIKVTGAPDDVVSLGLFLASSEARFITGETIVCDGGSQMKGWRP